MGEDAFYNQYCKMIMLEVTTRCNMNCSYCFKSKSQYKGTNLSLDTLDKIIEGFRDINHVVLCGMGEQFMHPDFYAIVDKLREHSLTFITNGTIPIDFQSINRHDNANKIVFSVDGPTEEICRKSCERYSFKHLLDNLDKAAKEETIQTAINYVMNENNWTYTVGMIDFCYKHGIKTIKLLAPSYSQTWSRNNRTGIDEEIQRTKERAKEYGVYVIEPDKYTCLFENSPIPYISTSGHVMTCCSHTVQVPIVGNLKKGPIKAMFEAPLYKKFRLGSYCRVCKKSEVI